MRPLLSLLFVVSSLAPLSAQNLHEDFSQASGETIPGWTVHTGKWSASFGIVESSEAKWSYMTCDALSAIRTGVFDVEIYYPESAGLYFAGFLARYGGPKASTEHLVAKVQDSKAKNNWNELFLYERPLGPNSSERIQKPARFVVLRTFLLESQWWCAIDVDLDGAFDQFSRRRGIGGAVTSRGLVGVSSFNGGRVARFDYYEAALYPDDPSPAKLGTNFGMTLEVSRDRLQASQNPAPWIALLSTGTDGIDLPGGAAIPLRFDDLLVASLSFGWAGLLSPTQNRARITLAIPNDANLVGLQFHAGALTLLAQTQDGFGAISNPVHIEIE